MQSGGVVDAPSIKSHRMNMLLLTATFHHHGMTKVGMTSQARTLRSFLQRSRSENINKRLNGAAFENEKETTLDEVVILNSDYHNTDAAAFVPGFGIFEGINISKFILMLITVGYL